VLTRSRIDPATRAYITRRLAEGKFDVGFDAFAGDAGYGVVTPP
jgi:hypothetical protein